MFWGGGVGGGGGRFQLALSLLGDTDAHLAHRCYGSVNPNSPRAQVSISTVTRPGERSGVATSETIKRSKTKTKTKQNEQPTHTHTNNTVCLLVDWLLNVPGTCWCISGTHRLLEPRVKIAKTCVLRQAS